MGTPYTRSISPLGVSWDYVFIHSCTYKYPPPILSKSLEYSALRRHPGIPLSSLCFSSPFFKRRERNSSFVTRSPLAQIACQVRSRVFQSSSVTRIARSLFRGSPDLGLAMLTLLFKGLAHDLETQHNNILVKNLGVSSYTLGVVLAGLCFGLDENVNERFSSHTRTLRVRAGTPNLHPTSSLRALDGRTGEADGTRKRRI